MLSLKERTETRLPSCRGWRSHAATGVDDRANADVALRRNALASANLRSGFSFALPRGDYQWTAWVNVFVREMKQTGGMRKTKLRGLPKVAWQFLMTAAAFNLWRLPKVQTLGV